MSNLVIVTIDGFAGSGKSSVSRELGKRAGFIHLNSGLLYRGLAFRLINEGISLENTQKIEDFLSLYKFDFILDKGDFRTRITINGQIIDDALLQSNEIGRGASQVGVHKVVRDELTEAQRRFRKSCIKLSSQGELKLQGIVLEGRDAGTIVFPDADFKFFLNASVEERAKRRLEEERVRGNLISFEELKLQIQNRDDADSNREFGALRVADNAIVIDTDGKSLSQVVDLIFNQVRKY